MRRPTKLRLAAIALVLVGLGLMWFGASLGAMLVPICKGVPAEERPSRCVGPVLYTLAAYVALGGAVVSLGSSFRKRRRSEGDAPGMKETK